MDLFRQAFSKFLNEDVFQIVRFGVSGLSSTFVYFGCMNLLVLAMHIEPLAASVIGYGLSVVFSYLMQSRFTFRAKEDSRRQMFRFLITSLFGFAVSYFSIVYFSEILGLHYVFGALMVCVILPLANYFIFKRWVFARFEDSPRS